VQLHACEDGSDEDTHFPDITAEGEHGRQWLLSLYSSDVLRSTAEYMLFVFLVALVCWVSAAVHGRQLSMAGSGCCFMTALVCLGVCCVWGFAAVHVVMGQMQDTLQGKDGRQWLPSVGSRCAGVLLLCRYAVMQMHACGYARVYSSASQSVALQCLHFLEHTTNSRSYSITSLHRQQSSVPYLLAYMI
jgi:hypothetical protein